MGAVMPHESEASANAAKRETRYTDTHPKPKTNAPSGVRASQIEAFAAAEFVSKQAAP